MAPRLSKAASVAVDRFLTENPAIDPKEVAELFTISYQSVIARRKGLRMREATGIDNRKVAGRPRLVTDEIREWVIELLIRDPTLYQDEIAQYIWVEFGVDLDIPQVSRLLKDERISRKKVLVSAAQQNEVLIAAWRMKMAEWDARQLIFVDESAYNERTGDRRYSWAPVGRSAKIKRWLKKSIRWSVLPAYTLEGYLNPIVF
jgi:transposase